MHVPRSWSPYGTSTWTYQVLLNVPEPWMGTFQDNRNPCAEGFVDSQNDLGNSAIPIAGFMCPSMWHRGNNLGLPFFQLSAGAIYLSTTQMSWAICFQESSMVNTQHNQYIPLPLGRGVSSCRPWQLLVLRFHLSSSAPWDGKKSTESFEGHTVHKYLKHIIGCTWLMIHGSVRRKHCLWYRWIDTSVQCWREAWQDSEQIEWGEQLSEVAMCITFGNLFLGDPAVVCVCVHLMDTINRSCFGAALPNKDQSNGTNIHPRSTEVQLLGRWCPDLVGYGPIPATSRQMTKVTKTSEEVASLSEKVDWEL